MNSTWHMNKECPSFDVQQSEIPFATQSQSLSPSWQICFQTESEYYVMWETRDSLMPFCSCQWSRSFINCISVRSLSETASLTEGQSGCSCYSALFEPMASEKRWLSFISFYYFFFDFSNPYRAHPSLWNECRQQPHFCIHLSSNRSGFYSSFVFTWGLISPVKLEELANLSNYCSLSQH